MESNFKKLLFLITYAAILFFAFLNFGVLMAILNKTVIIFIPFVYGLVIAYVLNWPCEFFKKRISSVSYEKLNFLRESHKQKFINILSIALSYSILMGVFAFIVVAIVPQLYANINQFIDNFDTYRDSFIFWSEDVENRFKLHLLPYNYTDTFLKGLTVFLDKFVQDLFPSVFNFTKNFAITVYNWIIGLVISLYILGSKEKLMKQIKLFAYSYIPNGFVAKITKILNLTHENFGKFFVGKIIDSFIVGILCFLGASFMKIPYTLLISVIVGITNIIPFFGPFIGAIPCILMIFIIDNVKAIWFAVFIIILQQIDGNIIGPKVLGNTVGISGIWIMFSVIVGGGFFGVPGMIFGVPVFAVIYNIISEHVCSR